MHYIVSIRMFFRAFKTVLPTLCIYRIYFVKCLHDCPAEVMAVNREVQLILIFAILWTWKSDTIRPDTSACLMFPPLCFCFSWVTASWWARACLTTWQRVLLWSHFREREENQQGGSILWPSLFLFYRNVSVRVYPPSGYLFWTLYLLNELER